MEPLEEETDYIMIFSIPECNLLCEYCRREDKKTKGVLTNEEISELGRACYDAGIRKLRWTGGEPTMRTGFPDLVSGMRNTGISDQYLSTNGTLLHGIAHDLRKAGISRVNISLDTFNRKKFLELTGKDLLEDVLRSIEVATREFELVKINGVLVSENIDDIHQFINFVMKFTENPPIPRFIPMGGCGGGTNRLYGDIDLVKPSEILKAFSEKYGAIRPFNDIENNNPYTQYYRIESKGVVFGIATSFFSVDQLNLQKFKTLRINPNGYVSNDLYSPDVYFLPGLDHNEMVEVLKKLIKDKESHDRNWYVKAVNELLKYNIDFWRFGE